jgi:hypothetical protein
VALEVLDPVTPESRSLIVRKRGDALGGSVSTDEEVPERLAAVPEEERGECWWLVLRDGTPVPATAAAESRCSPRSG